MVARAIASGISPSELYKSNDNEKTASRSWYSDSVECKGRTGKVQGLDCDEYPYFSTKEGGPTKYSNQAVVLEPVSISDNRGAGSKLKWFYAKCGVLPDTDKLSDFIVSADITLLKTFWTGAIGRPCSP